jgi:hypothetical protein
MHFVEELKKINACEDAIEWCETQPDLEMAWRVCTRGDWMLWLAGKLSGPPGDGRKQLVACAMEVAMLARQYASPDVQTAMDRCERAVSSWADGRCTLEDVRLATAYIAYYDDDANTANIYAYYASDASYAPSAVYYAIRAVYYATRIAVDTISFANIAFYANASAYYAAASAYAAADHDYDAKIKTISLAADIVRWHYPVSPEFPDS